MDLSQLLGDEQLYLQAIDKLHRKNAKTNSLFKRTQQGVSLAAFAWDRKRLARTLARAVASGRYELQTAHTRSVKIGKKTRLLYDFQLTDLIVHDVVSSIIAKTIQPRLSTNVYSHVKGRSWWTSVRAFARYVRKHCAGRSQVKDRGLYVLRRDVSSYGDSIPVGESSHLWQMLKDTLQIKDETLATDPHWKLVQHVIRPERYTEQRDLVMNLRGIPTGSPISGTLGNLYLMELDGALEQVPDSFYSRYCDDFLFAHPDPNVVQSADQQIDHILDEKGLVANKSKEGTVFFNGAGCHSDEWTMVHGTQFVSFLGCTISFESTVSLSREKVRRFLKDVTSRVRRTALVTHTENLDATGELVCTAINRALNPRCRICVPAAPLLRSVITDRRQLKELDYQIARIVARQLTGKAGVKAFREIPYRKIREEWKLDSLYHARNLVGRSQRRTP